MQQILRVPLCAPDWFICAKTSDAIWYPPQKLPANKVTLEQEEELLQLAVSVDSNHSTAYLHLAEVMFSLGKRREAAAILTGGGWGIEYQSGVQKPDYLLAPPVPVIAPRSPLLMEGRYEYHIIRAYQHTNSWENVVRNFRLGLAYAGERALPQDRQDFFWASAHWHLEHREAYPTERALAGKYLTLSGEWTQAVNVLRPLLDADTTLSQKERAWAALYLGRAYEALENFMEAKYAYQLGWEATPEVRQNAIRLLALLRTIGDKEQAEAIGKQLLELGATYPSGVNGPGYHVPYRVPYIPVFPSEWNFAGYELDPESIEHGVPLELWLWWQKPSAAQLASGPDGQLVDLGDYLLQHQWVVNLAVNSAFEWGEQPDGLPVGWSGRIYSEAPSSFYVTTAMRDGRRTQVGVGSNLNNDSSGLRGLKLPMQTDGWYLMAGWMNDTEGGNIGRNCVGSEFQPGGPYYIAYPNQTQPRPDGVWLHFADLAPAFPNEKPDECQILLVNYQSPGGITMWDDLVLARISPPWLLGD